MKLTIKPDLTLQGLAARINFGNACETDHFFTFMKRGQMRPMDELTDEGFRELLLSYAEYNEDAGNWLIIKGLADTRVDYKPITITLRTLGEARAMWHRLNMNSDHFDEAYKDKGLAHIRYYRDEQHLTFKVWDKLDEEIRRMLKCR